MVLLNREAVFATRGPLSIPSWGRLDAPVFAARAGLDPSLGQAKFFEHLAPDVACCRTPERPSFGEQSRYLGLCGIDPLRMKMMHDLPYFVCHGFRLLLLAALLVRRRSRDNGCAQVWRILIEHVTIMIHSLGHVKQRRGRIFLGGNDRSQHLPKLRDIHRERWTSLGNVWSYHTLDFEPLHLKRSPGQEIQRGEVQLIAQPQHLGKERNGVPMPPLAHIGFIDPILRAKALLFP